MPQIYQVRLNSSTLAMLEGAFQYIQRDSPQNAARMIERILDAIDRLDLFPHRYPVLPGEERSGTRSMPVPPYVVRYRVEEQTQSVHILQVYHGARAL